MKIIAQSDYKEAVKLLKENKIVAFPTETVFGLGILANSKENFKKLVKVKKRPSDKPFTLMCYSLNELNNIIEIDDFLINCVNKLCPGKITIVTKAKKNIASFYDLGSGFVGFRIPDNKMILNILKEIKEPLFVPSANISNYPPAKNINEVYEYFNEEIDGVIEGEIKNGIPSTVIKIDNGSISILREGELTLKEIKEKL